MPALGALIAGLFGSLAAFFAQFVGIKVAFAVAAITVFAVLTVAFVAVIATTITSIAWSGTLPPSFILGFSFFMPSNFPTVVSAVIALKISSALYRWNARQVALVAG